MLTKLKNGLDGTQLKTIALVLMVLDAAVSVLHGGGLCPYP